MITDDVLLGENTMSARMAEVLGTGSAPASEYLLVAMRVDGQLCGVPVQYVQDVLGETRITPVPLSAPEIIGSLNLRGRIVTAVDLRRRFGIPPAPEQAEKMAAVVEVRGELYALMVDVVTEVLTLPAAGFDRLPPHVSAQWMPHCAGVYRMPGELMLVLDVDRMFDPSDLPVALPHTVEIMS